MKRRLLTGSGMQVRLGYAVLALVVIGCTEKPKYRPYSSLPTTRPAIMPADPNRQVGDYRVEGHVQRAGIYHLTTRPTGTTLKQAIVAAGSLDAVVIDHYITVTRMSDSGRITIRKNGLLSGLYAGEESDIMLQAGDEIYIGDKKE